MTSPAVFSERLRRLRKMANKFPREVAEDIGVSERQYRSFEDGRFDVLLAKLEQLAQYFGVSPEYFWTTPRPSSVACAPSLSADGEARTKAETQNSAPTTLTDKV